MLGRPASAAATKVAPPVPTLPSWLLAASQSKGKRKAPRDQLDSGTYKYSQVAPVGSKIRVNCCKQVRVERTEYAGGWQEHLPPVQDWKRRCMFLRPCYFCAWGTCSTCPTLVMLLLVSVYMDICWKGLCLAFFELTSLVLWVGIAFLSLFPHRKVIVRLAKKRKRFLWVVHPTWSKWCHVSAII